MGIVGSFTSVGGFVFVVQIVAARVCLQDFLLCFLDIMTFTRFKGQVCSQQSGRPGMLSLLYQQLGFRDQCRSFILCDFFLP